jgi:hypothetical protein
MTSPRTRSVSIVTGIDQTPLSNGQKAFNSLIKQIEKKRAKLAAWEASVSTYRQKYSVEIAPLLEAAQNLQAKIVHGLDRAIAFKGLTKSERRQLAELITELAGELVDAHDDPELKAIYNRHSQADYDTEEAASLEGMKAMLEDVLGFELENDPASPAELLARAKAQIEELEAREAEAHEVREQARRGRQKKSAKQLIKEAQELAEAEQLRRSMREIYRKLASALHPDRETDPEEHARKTTLMQRVNQAYDKHNLLQLLELQLEVEQIDQHTIANLSEDRLKHYNKILKDQLLDLEREIRRLEDGFRMQFGVTPFMRLSPTSLMRSLAREAADLQRSIRELKADLRAFEDPKKLKSWLRDIRQASRDAEDFDEWEW